MRMLSIILLMGLIPLLVTYFLLSGHISNLIVENYATNMQSGMNDTALLIEQVLDGYRNLPQNIYNNSTYLEMLRHGTTYKNNAEFNSLKTTISVLFTNEQTISAVRFYMPRQSQVLGMNRKTWTMLTNGYLTSDDVDSYEEGGRMFRLRPLQDIESFDSSRPAFTGIQYIPDFPWNDLLAVFAMDITGKKLDDLLMTGSMFEHENLCLLTGAGELLYRRGMDQLTGEFFGQLLDNLDFDSTYVNRFKLGGETYLAFTMPLSKYDLHVLRFVPLSDLTRRTTGILRRTMFIALLLLFLVLLLGISLSNRALRPLRTLSAHMQRMETGHLGETMEEAGLDREFMLLAHRFNQMSNEIERLIRETYQLQLSQRTAELNALQSQINPHFIFNTLQSVHYFALEHNAYEINLIVDSLSDILRYSLRGSSDTVTLREELSIVEKYLHIQQVRFIDRLAVRVEAQPQALDVVLPRMSLQPLVENSVIHGMKENDRACTVSISARMTENGCCLDIEDDGMGIAPERLEEIRRSLDLNDPDLFGKKSIGVRNCWLRLKYMYGEALTFQIDSAWHEGTRIHIEIAGAPRLPGEEGPACDA